jgi:hypothetical protein
VQGNVIGNFYLLTVSTIDEYRNNRAGPRSFCEVENATATIGDLLRAQALFDDDPQGTVPQPALLLYAGPRVTVSLIRTIDSSPRYNPTTRKGGQHDDRERATESETT